MPEAKDLSILSGNISPAVPTEAPIRAKHYKIVTTAQDLPQFGKTIKAYLEAGMPLEHIANAGAWLGYEVEKGQIDAPLLTSQKVAEIRESEGQVLAWQNRGEIVAFRPQLASPEGLTGTELVITTQGLTVSPSQDQNIRVIEGIAVKQEVPQVVEPNTQDELLSNPYLQPLKKAA